MLIGVATKHVQHVKINSRVALLCWNCFYCVFEYV